MLQLEGGRIVYKSLGALCDTCTTIIEIHAGLQNKGEKNTQLNHVAAFGLSFISLKYSPDCSDLLQQ